MTAAAILPRRLWLVGGAVSVLAHVGLAWVLAVALQTRPVPSPPEAAADVSITLHEGRTAHLSPADASGDALEDSRPDAGRSPLVSPPRTRAGARPPPSVALGAASPRGDLIAPAAEPADGAAAAAPPAALLPEVAAAADDLPARPVPPARASPAAPEATALADAEPEPAPRLPAAAPPSASVAASAAAATALAGVAAEAAVATPAALAGDRIGAAFAPPAPLTTPSVAAVSPRIEAGTAAASAVLPGALPEPAEAAPAELPAAPLRAAAPDVEVADPVAVTVAGALAPAPAAAVAVPAAAQAPRELLPAPFAGLRARPALPPAAQTVAAAAMPGPIRLAAGAREGAALPAAPPRAAALSARPAEAAVAPALPPDPQEVAEAVAALAGAAQLTSAAPSATALAVTVQAATGLPPAPPPAAALAARAAETSVARPVRPPDPQELAASPAVLARTAELTGATASMAALTDALPSAPLVPLAQSRQAALAWSGERDSRLDPQSLAAIESFMTPAAAAAGPSVRDQLDAALRDLPCSRLAAAFSPATGGIAVRGHARDDATAAAAVVRVAAAAGPSIPVEDDIRILPEPQCRLLEAVEAVGLPQSTDQADDPLVVGRASQLSYQPFEDGDRMEFFLGAADFDGYLYVDYFDAAGSVVHVTPSELVPLRVLRTGEQIHLGRAGDEGPGVHMTAAAPFGKDLLVALATTHPLERGPRPIREDGLGYLEDLRRAVAAARAAAPTFRGEWVYVFVETFPRGGRRERRTPPR